MRLKLQVYGVQAGAKKPDQYYLNSDGVEVVTPEEYLAMSWAILVLAAVRSKE